MVQIFPLDGISDDAVFLLVSNHPGMVSPSRALTDPLRLFLPHSTGLQILTTFRTMLVDGAQITMISSAWPSLPSFLFFLIYFFFMYIGRKVSDSLEPELQTVVN